MEADEIITIVAKVVALLMTVALFVILVIGMKKDGKLTADEAAKVIIMGLLIYMTIVNGARDTEWPIYDQGILLIMLSAVLVLAGIDVAKAKDLFKKNGKDEKDQSDK